MAAVSQGHPQRRMSDVQPYSAERCEATRTRRGAGKAYYHAAQLREDSGPTRRGQQRTRAKAPRAQGESGGGGYANRSADAITERAYNEVLNNYIDASTRVRSEGNKAKGILGELHVLSYLLQEGLFARYIAGKDVYTRESFDLEFLPAGVEYMST